MKLFETFKKNTFFHLIFLVALTATLRFYKFRQGEIITSSDEIYLYEYSLKPIYGLLSGNFSVVVTEFFRFFNFSWGWGTLMWSTLFASLLSLLKIPLTEQTINFPYVIVGILSILAAYFVGKEIHSAWYGFIVAFFIAIMPSHIAYSRSIGVNGIVGLLFFFCTLWCFIKYQKKQKKTYLIMTYIFFAFYFVSDNQGLGILPLLVFISYIYSSKKEYLTRIKDACTKTFSWKGITCFIAVLLPTIAGAFYLAEKGLLKNSYLNLFHSKPIILNFYFKETLFTIAQNAGIVLTTFLLLGFLFYVLLLFSRKTTKQSTIIFAWFFIYSASWLFFIPPHAVDVRVYNTPTICSLIFLAGYMILALEEKIALMTKKNFRYTGYAIFSIFIFFIVGSTFFVTARSVYDYNLNFFSDDNPVGLLNFAPMQEFGAVGENNGIKTIGYYVREQTPENVIIFVDVESFTAQYYLNRSIIGSLDLSAEQTLLLFEKTDMTNVSYVFIQAQNQHLFEKEIFKEGFVPLVYAKENNIIKGILYAKSLDYTKDTQEQSEFKRENFTTFTIQEYDALFDKKYGSIEELFIDFG